MARKASIEKQRKRERLIQKHFEQRLALKKIVSSESASFEEKQQAAEKLNKLPKNSSYIRSRNRCVMTGRARGYLRKFQLSRISFRELANSGHVPGVFKASW